MSTFPLPCRYEAATHTVRTTPGNHWVATVDSFDGIIAPDRHAWGHLLAAAPDLLAALQALMPVIGTLTGWPEYKAASAAIAKARGEAA